MSCKSPIYRLAHAEAWVAAQAAGSYEGGPDDARDGYLHFSAADQLAETLRRHYAGARNLVLLTVDAESLPIVWEPSRGGALFPHLYGALPLSAVLKAEALPCGADGNCTLPALQP